VIGLESDPEVALSPKSNVVRFENPKADALSNSSAAPVDAASASSPAPKERAPDPRSVSLVLAGDPGNLKGTVQSAPQVIEPEAEIEKADTPQEATAVEPNAPVEAGTPLGTFFKFFFLTISSSVALLWYTIASTGRYFVRHPFHVLLNLAMIVALALGVVTGSEIHSKMIRGQISDRTVDAIIEGSRFTREYDAEEINRNGARDFLRVGAPRWTQREAVRAILFHARKAGLNIEDQSVLLAVADIESGFNPLARAPTTTACGIFQFVKRTGEMFGLSQSECMDPWQNAEAGVAHCVYNYEPRIARQLQDVKGTERLFRAFELSYYLHHDGPESNNPSNEVKATILNGTHFMFRAYHSLVEESESQQRAPTFTE